MNPTTPQPTGGTTPTPPPPPLTAAIPKEVNMIKKIPQPMSKNFFCNLIFDSWKFCGEVFCLETFFL